jgi:hypothetical protein
VGKYNGPPITSEKPKTLCESVRHRVLKFTLRDSIFSPRNIWIRLWEVTIFGFIIFQALYIPFYESFQPALSKGWVVLDDVVDTMFFVDLLLRFSIAVPVKTPQRHQQVLRLNYSRTYIAKDYMSCWFWIDSISCMSFFFRFSSSTDDLVSVGLLKTVRLPRLLRLLRLLRLVKVSNTKTANWYNWIMYSRYANLWRLFSLIVSIFLSAHFLACGWNAVATKENFTGMDSDNTFEQYIGAYYYALLLLMGEELLTETVGEQIFAILTIVLGAVSMAVIFGNVALVVSSFSANGTKYQKKKESLYEAMTYMSLPPDLQDRVLGYYDYIWSEHHSSKFCLVCLDACFQLPVV